MLSLKELIGAGVHFGHRTSRWHPQMAPYVWGAKNKIHLIDVAKTAFLLERACRFLKTVAATNKPVLLVGTKKSAQDIITKHALEKNVPYVAHRWIGGTLSNFDQVKKAVTRLLHLRDVCNGSVDRYTKKELSMLQKERERLEKNVGGITALKSLPAALVVVDARKERAAIREANAMNIPVVCLVDTNSDPAGVNYIIPANDDSPKSIALVFAELATAIAAGLAERPSSATAPEAAPQLDAAGMPVTFIAVDEEGEDEAGKRARRRAGGRREGDAVEAEAPRRKSSQAPARRKTTRTE